VGSEHTETCPRAIIDLMSAEEKVSLLDELLIRSEAFESALVACFPASGVFLAVSSPRQELVATACTLSAEHALVLRSAFAQAAPNAGASLLRLQYEALLRAAWLLYAATPAQVDKLTKVLELEAEQAAKNLPGYLAMLEAIVAHAPRGLSASLAEFSHYSRHALNSFVHGGIHPLRRSKDGFPVQLAHRIVLMSNGLQHIAYLLLAELTGSRRRLDRVMSLSHTFHDCLPLDGAQREEHADN
jgi:hypothetical protein